MEHFSNICSTMSYLRFKLFILFSFCFHCSLQQFVPFPDTDPMPGNYLQSESDGDDLEWSQANWQLVIPWLLQLQQVRLCVAVSRYNQQLVHGTPCVDLLATGPLMASCDIGHIEDLSVTMRDAFGPMLFDTMQKCRPGLELFGVRCRRRA